MGRSNKNRKRNLMREDPHCYWCGIEVTEYSQEEILQFGLLPLNMATVDHLNVKHKGRRKQLRSWQLKLGPVTVLACLRCNMRRGNDLHQGVHWTQGCRAALPLQGTFCTATLY